ncbi:hypothetical protein [Streptomyces actuosus]|uniref:hypothetical protein n=1 Tax=Streptomyces actuosus TaxID=1885 RepID=UPI001F06F293|nr:hypothetical protein [Streptomyces actuosus]
MTATSSATGRQRFLFVPVPAKSVPPTPPRLPDPPIYREMMRTWADRGRTLPGRHDPEWVRLAAPQVRPGQFSGLRGHTATGEDRPRDQLGALDNRERQSPWPRSASDPVAEGRRSTAAV